jgi:aspartyl protease family protein
MSDKSPTHNINIFVFVAFWIVLFGSIVYLFYRWHEINVGGIQEVIDNKTKKEVVIRMDSSNYYRANGTINNLSVNFIVDTGANSVAIPNWLAKKAGLKALRQINVQTAGGNRIGYITRIKELTVGPIKLYNIRALIMEDDAKYVLLGMSALRKLELRQRDDYLVLIQHITTIK